MTRGDLFIEIIAELSGEPAKYVAEMLYVIRINMPPELHRFDEDISEAEAGQLRDELMQEKEAILKWFFEGYRRFLWRVRMPQGDV